MKLKKNQLLLLTGIIIFIGMVAMGIWFVVNYSNRGMIDIDGNKIVSAVDFGEQTKEPEKPQNIGVHVKGAVVSPGYYELPEGSRIKDLLQAAGGATEDVDMQAINLARKLTDAEEIIIYSKSQGDDNSNKNSTAKPQAADKPKGGSSSSGSSSDGVSAKVMPGEVININVAGVEELMRLPGVGKTTAHAIVDYREQNGKFYIPADIMKVKGIGQSTFDKMKEYIVL